MRKHALAVGVQAVPAIEVRTKNVCGKPPTTRYTAEQVNSVYPTKPKEKAAPK